MTFILHGKTIVVSLELVLISLNQISKKSNRARGGPVSWANNFFYDNSILIDDKAFRNTGYPVGGFVEGEAVRGDGS